MRWVLTIGPPEQRHGHVEVVDPSIGALIINEINDVNGGPVACKIESYESEWYCDQCGQWRFEEQEHAHEG